MGSADARTPQGPLSGIRILDLTINVLGPVATQQLGDMGAEVIKVEPPHGDPMRNTGPSRNPGMSAFFLNMNRNKKSVVLNLKDEANLRTLFKLAKSADVIVHSMRPRAADRLGLDYEVLKQHNPNIIYAFAPGYRQDGPFADRPAYDDVIQGECGLADLVHRASGRAGYLPTVAADKICGLLLASAIGMALFCRERTGIGQKVEIPMLESMLSFALVEHLWEGAFGQTQGFGYDRALSEHRKPYETLDGHICVLAVNDKQWVNLFHALERPELATDERFSTIEARSRYINQLYAILAAQIRQRSTSEWQARFDQADIPNGPVRNLCDMPNDPYLSATRFFTEYEHPTEGTVVTTSVPQRFSETPGGFYLPPPRLGEHTAQVLQELELNEVAI